MNQFLRKISIKSSLQNAIVPSCRRHKFPQHRIIADWVEIVGPELASITIPMKLIVPNHIGGNKEFFIAESSAEPGNNARRQPQAVLVCGIANSAFALRIQMSEQLILERINLYFGYKAIYKIQLRSAEFAFVPKHDDYPTYRKKIVPSDVMHNMENSVREVSDPDLQELLNEMLQRNFEI